MMAEIRIAVERLDNLVANLLNLTRLQSGVLKPHLDWCDGHDLAAAARRAVETRLEGHGLALEFPPDFPIFLADAGLMEQAISHLILNAAVHTPPATQIRVTGGLSADSKDIFIAVSDNGPGISAELRERIFEKFSRGAGAPAGGLGLGLSIVRGFMLAQGGKVSVESPAEGGTRFTLSLPYSTYRNTPKA
jgi:two-component system sensor histidine kinase KdpD